MPRRLLRKLSPNPDKLKQNKHLQFLGDALHLPCLWHLNRRNVSIAFAIGLFIMWLPTPGQSVIAGALAVLLRANLPLSIALVFVTNPVTMPPMLYGAYEVGSAILGGMDHEFSFEPSMEWVMNGLILIWKPLLLGITIMAIGSSMAGYYGVRALWRTLVLKRWRERCQQRKQQTVQRDTANCDPSK